MLQRYYQFVHQFFLYRSLNSLAMYVYIHTHRVQCSNQLYYRFYLLYGIIIKTYTQSVYSIVYWPLRCDCDRFNVWQPTKRGQHRTDRRQQKKNMTGLSLLRSFDFVLCFFAGSFHLSHTQNFDLVNIVSVIELFMFSFLPLLLVFVVFFFLVLIDKCTRVFTSLFSQRIYKMFLYLISNLCRSFAY